MSLDIEYLIGRKVFSGWDDCISTQKELAWYNNGVAFVLDNECYEIYEDECDGYRSTATGLYTSSLDRCKNQFQGIPVHIYYKPNDEGVLNFVFEPLNSVVAQIGTANHTDYYPYVNNRLYVEELNQAIEYYNKHKIEKEAERVRIAELIKDSSFGAF